MHEQDRAGQREIWITRGHLWALAFMMVFIGALAFFVGLLYGQSRAARIAGPPPSPALVDADLRADALDELLARLEALQVEDPQDGALTFQGTLPEGTALSVPAEPDPEEARAAELLPGRGEPEAPEAVAAASAPPAGGWTVQVASFPTVEEADAYVAALAEREVAAHHVAALVRGETRFRVRVGSYASRESAEAALPGLTASLGVVDAIVVKVE